jgi:hypothetical protein
MNSTSASADGCVAYAKIVQQPVGPSEFKLCGLREETCAFERGRRTMLGHLPDAL